jgi:hypothetical protein
MKKQLLAYCVLPLFFTPLANAGINGTYRVSGSETADGEKLSFTGTVKVARFLNGAYSLKFSDGENATYTFKFTKPLKETTASQTVTAKNNIGTSTATFYSKSGKMWVKFKYKSLDGTLKGNGTGSK